MTRGSAYEVAVELRRERAQDARAELLTPVAVAHCLARGWTAAQLAEQPEGTWHYLADLIGMRRYPSPTTRAKVVLAVEELLPHPCPRCGEVAAGDEKCEACQLAELRPLRTG